MRWTRIPVMALSMLMTIAVSAHLAPDEAADCTRVTLPR